MLGKGAIRLLAAGWALGAAWILISTAIIPATGHMTHGYVGYHTASYLLVHGEWGPQVYDNASYIARVQALLKQPVGEIITPNLPTVTLLGLPLVGFDPQTARDIWIWANLPLLIGAVGLLARNQPAARWPTAGVAGLAALTFLLPATRANFWIGQAYIVLLGLFSLALVALRRDQDWLVGIALGLAFMLKASGGPIWLGLVLGQRWRALAWGSATCLLLFTLPWIGLASWLSYPAALQAATSTPLLALPT